MKKQKNYFLDLFALLHANDKIVLIPINDPKFSECFDLKPENIIIHQSSLNSSICYNYGLYDFYLKDPKFKSYNVGEDKLFIVGVVTDNGTTLVESSAQPKENNQFHIHDNFKLIDSNHFISDICDLIDSKLIDLKSDLIIGEEDDIEFLFITSNSEFHYNNIWKSLNPFEGYYLNQLNDFFITLFDNDDFEEFISKKMKYNLFNKLTHNLFDKLMEEGQEKEDDEKYQEALNDLKDQCFEIDRNKMI
jgi:hypothetical protein